MKSHPLRTTVIGDALVRMLDVTQSLSLLPQSHGARTELAAPLAVTGALEAYSARHPQLDADHLFNFMALDLDNPASVLSCLRSARENAHAVRGQITAEMWEAINSTWLEGRTFPKRGIPSVSRPPLTPSAPAATYPAGPAAIEPSTAAS